MNISELIRILLVRCGNISEAELARRLGTSAQNLSGKFKRNNFSVNELTDIGNALNCTFSPMFIKNDTGEEIK